MLLGLLSLQASKPMIDESRRRFKAFRQAIRAEGTALCQPRVKQMRVPGAFAQPWVTFPRESIAPTGNAVKDFSSMICAYQGN